MAEKREEMRKMLLNNINEPPMPVKQPKLNGGQSEEGNYSRTVSEVEPPIKRRNNMEREID